MINFFLEHKRLGDFLTVPVFQEQWAQVKFDTVKGNKQICYKHMHTHRMFVESIYILYTYTSVSSIYQSILASGLFKEKVFLLSFPVSFICDLLK